MTVLVYAQGALNFYGEAKSVKIPKKKPLKMLKISEKPSKILKRYNFFRIQMIFARISFTALNIINFKNHG